MANDIAATLPGRRPLLLPVPEVCSETHLSRTTVWRLIRDGKLRAVKVGSRTLVPADSLDAFVAQLPSVSA